MGQVQFVQDDDSDAGIQPHEVPRRLRPGRRLLIRQVTSLRANENKIAAFVLYLVLKIFGRIHSRVRNKFVRSRARQWVYANTDSSTPYWTREKICDMARMELLYMLCTYRMKCGCLDIENIDHLDRRHQSCEVCSHIRSEPGSWSFYYALIDKYFGDTLKHILLQACKGTTDTTLWFGQHHYIVCDEEFRLSVEKLCTMILNYEWLRTVETLPYAPEEHGFQAVIDGK